MLATGTGLDFLHFPPQLAPPSRRFSPDLDRDAAANVERAGFCMVREEKVTLELVKAFEGRPC